MAREFFKRLDKWLNRWELRGHNAANNIHRWAINIVLLTMAYNVYTIVKGYNSTMIEMRVVSYFIRT